MTTQSPNFGIRLPQVTADKASIQSLKSLAAKAIFPQVIYSESVQKMHEQAVRLRLQALKEIHDGLEEILNP